MRTFKKAAAFVAVASLGLAACSAGSSSDDTAADDGGDTTEAADDGGDTTEAADDGGDDAAATTEAADGDGDDAAATTEAASDDSVAATQAGDITIAMITHSDDGPFWTVVKRGADQAAEDLGITVQWLGSNNDPEKQVQDIEQATSQGVSGIASSLPSPDQLTAPLQAAVAAGIPVVTLNSGVDQYQEIGAITHVGQTEFIAGQGAGLRFNELGATKILCGYQEQSNVALEERCNGVADTFEGEVVSEFMGLDADTEAQQNAISAAMQADEAFDGFMGPGPVIAMSGLRAAQDLGRDMVVGGFDITPEITDAIEAGDVAFTVDQQQYLQGYLSVLFLYLNVTNGNTVGGGQPVLTGPGFVDSDNVTTVKELVAAGTR